MYIILQHHQLHLQSSHKYVAVRVAVDSSWSISEASRVIYVQHTHQLEVIHASATPRTSGHTL